VAHWTFNGLDTNSMNEKLNIYINVLIFVSVSILMLFVKFKHIKVYSTKYNFYIVCTRGRLF